MPELPEVETIRRELEGLIIGKIFARPVALAPQSIEALSPEDFIAVLEGRSVEEVGRKGKYLYLRLDQGFLAVHLRMTGNLIFYPAEHRPEERFLRVLLPFTDGSSLAFSDMRRFGRLFYVADQKELEEETFKNVGPDLHNELTLEDFVKKLDGAKTRRLKALLLDQKFAAGMGNIYTDECLFRCRFNPKRQVGSLSPEERKALYQAAIKVLEEGIAFGGTTYRDYRSAEGALGSFQERLAVYNRAGEECPRCQAIIIREKVAGRGTYYCPSCQNLEESEE